MTVILRSKVSYFSIHLTLSGCLFKSVIMTLSFLTDPYSISVHVVVDYTVHSSHVHSGCHQHGILTSLIRSRRRLRREESAGTSAQSLERRLPNRELVTVKAVAYGILWGWHPFVKTYLCYD